MNKLIDMKRPPEKKRKEQAEIAMTSSEPAYPYGLQLQLENEQLDKLGLKTLPDVGGRVKIEAVGTITEASEHDSQQRGKRRRLEIQIKKLALAEAPGSTGEAVDAGIREANAAKKG